MLKKGILYLLCGFLLTGIFCLEIGPVSQAAKHNYVLRDMKAILFGMDGEKYEGTEIITNREISMEFTNCTGVRKIPITCRKGANISLEINIKDRLTCSEIYLSNDVGRLHSSTHTTSHLDYYREYYHIGKDGTYYLNLDAYKAAGRIYLSIY